LKVEDFKVEDTEGPDFDPARPPERIAMPVSPVYEVLSPEGLPATGDARREGVAPLAGLEGRRIGLFWNGFTNGNLLLEALADILGKRCRGLSFVKLPAGRELDWGHYPERSLTDIVREYAIDAAIAGPGC
jgi:hypothetical protein